MDEIPRLRIELDGIKQSVIHMFNQNNEELNNMIIAEFDKQLTSEFVQLEINKAVSECIRKSISGVTSDWNLQQAITRMISDNIAELIKD